MKKIWSAIARSASKPTYQQRAVKQVEKIEAGEVKITAPKHATEKKYFEEAQKNENARKDLEAKHQGLIDNVNQMTITSTDPVERWTPVREGPTRETEWLHRNDPAWEYGFYEPPEENIPQGKLMFREALEVMRARLELEDNAGPVREQVPEAKKVLEEHPAVHRVPKELLDNMWLYFRPFERKDTQKVVSTRELSVLQDALQGHSHEIKLTGNFREKLRKLAERGGAVPENVLEKLEADGEQEFIRAVEAQREAEHQRLTQRLLQIEAIESELSDAEQKAKRERESKRNENDDSHRS